MAGGRRWRRRGVAILGLGVLMVAGVIGTAYGWHATGTEEYPPLVVAWVLLTPMALSAATFAVRRGPVARRRLRRTTGLAVALLVVGGLALMTKSVDPCDLRGPGVVLVRCDLSGRDMRGANLIGGDLRGANLSMAKLGGADLTRANLTEARLTRADSGKAILTEGHLEGAFLDGANLAGANLDHAILTGATLAGADLSDASLVKTRLGGASLVRARLVRASLQETDLSRANLAGADLSQARGTRVNLAAAIMTGANLDGARLGEADLGAANLTGASLAGTDLSSARAGGADLSRAVLQGTDLRKATLDRATFSGARLRDANLREASLKDAVMSETTMSNVAFDSAELGGVVDLDDTTLASALGVEYRLGGQRGYGNFDQLRRNEIARSRTMDPLQTYESRGQATFRGGGGEAYDLGFLAADYLVNTKGLDAVAGTVWTELRTKDWWAAFASAFGESVDQFYANFEEYRRSL